MKNISHSQQSTTKAYIRELSEKISATSDSLKMQQNAMNELHRRVN